jgi:3-carboxy-cis,cis-muconate cycloisomerase
MPVRLLDSLASTEALADLFSDGSILQAMLDFEVALARVEARLGIIPANAASAIAAGAANLAAFDCGDLSRRALRSGTLGIPLVKALSEVVASKDASSASFVHWGATSQDVTDTALVLLLKRARPLIEHDLSRAEQAFCALSEQHKSTVMTGRTLLQAAPPTTFGLKSAEWAAAIRRCHDCLERTFDEALVLQFGGASGTLAMLGERGQAVARELAAELQLACPDAPWHTQRDRMASLICAFGVLTGSLGKIARDISLLMQTEVGEVAEPGGDGRGGSSTMPQKHNPSGCAITLAAANRVPGLVSSYLSAMVQEHERSVGGSQSEWPVVAGIVQATAAAAASVREIAEGITVDATRMRQNLDATRGTIFAEKAMALLAGKIGRSAAHELLEKATQKVVAENRPLGEVLSEIPEVAKHLDKNTLQQLAVAEHYLGSAEAFRLALLQPSRQAEKKR